MRKEALIASTGNFWSTVIICAITGLVIVSSVLANQGAAEINNINGAVLTHFAFESIKYVGPLVLTIGLITFAFSTILGWAYYGERGLEYLFGVKVNMAYRIIYIISAFVGVIVPLGFVWNLADLFNALMAIPNLIAVLMLSNIVVKETKYYLEGNNIDKFDNVTVPIIKRR